jgi:uncharacterized phage protein gp47/JayE
MTQGTYVTAQGLDIPSVEDLLADIAAEQRSTMDPGLNTDPDGPVGQMNGIFAAHLRRAWEVLGIAWNGNNPDAAEGFLLEAVSAITGTTKAPATRSKFAGDRKLRLNLNAATTVPIGTTFHVAGDPNTSFHTTEEKTSVGAGDYLVSAECDITGPVPCNATTLTVIATPVAGLNSVINDFDAALGANQDNDAQLRERRERELRATGSATVDALRSDILAIALEDGSKPVIEAIILENTSNVVDGDGLPGHSLECLVFDGVTQDCPNDTIAQTIWDSKPGGIQLVGTSSGTAIDSKNVQRTILFSRPTNKEVVLQATLTLANPSQLPSQYLDAVRAAVMAEFARRVRMGSVIRCNHYEAAILAIPGIEDAVVRLGFNPPGTLGVAGANLSLGTREIGYVQSSGTSVV